MLRFLPFLLFACSTEPASPSDDLLHGQAWHMLRAPHVFGDEVKPENAGCTMRSVQDGRPVAEITYDDRGRQLQWSSSSGLVKQAKWTGPCRWFEEVGGGLTDSTTLSTCVGGWPIPTLVTVDGTPHTAGGTERHFDGRRLVEVVEDGELLQTWAWEGDEVVSTARFLPELGPEPLVTDFFWEDGQMVAAVSDVESLGLGEVFGAVYEWDRDAEGRVTAEYHDGFLKWTNTYDEAGRLSRIDQPSGSEVLIDWDCE